MGAAFKESINARSLQRMARAFSQRQPNFPENEFLKNARRGLGSLELKGRVRHVAAALRMALPQSLAKAYPLLAAVAASESNPRGLRGFEAWPLLQFVEDFGLADPERSLDLLAKLTPAMSAEFAVRPFLLRHPALALARMQSWSKSSDFHLRRLASEGTRPRLPWGQRLGPFLADPEICAPLLRQLRHDSELYVRKSVANHLNDISKDHPDWLLKELRRWNEAFPRDENVQWILRHSCRSLVKAGHPEALRLLGFEAASFENARLRIHPSEVNIGGEIRLEFSARAKKAGAWVVDYALHHLRANGKTNAKVFKWAKRTMASGESLQLGRAHSFRAITTRRYYPGVQEVEVFVNGKSAARAKVRLNPPV